MSDEKQYVKKRFSFTVNTPNMVYTPKFDLDRNIKLVNALLMSADNPSMLFYRGSQRIELNGEELFPEDYESRLLMSGISVPPNQKYTDLGDGVVAGNGELKLLYKDADNPQSIFQPYIVSIYLQCELG